MSAAVCCWYSTLWRVGQSPAGHIRSRGGGGGSVSGVCWRCEAQQRGRRVQQAVRRRGEQRLNVLLM